MKARINEKCIGCGTCVSLTDSKVFDFNDEGKAKCIVDKVPEDMEEVVVQSQQFCPAPDGGAIEVIEE